MKPLRNPENAAAAEVATELFDSLGEIRIKAMFGGGGVLCDDIFFACIFEGDIYIKTDDAFASELAKAGSQQFLYKKPSTGKVMKMGYWRLPESAMSDPEKAAILGKRAIGIARKKK